MKVRNLQSLTIQTIQLFRMQLLSSKGLEKEKQFLLTNEEFFIKGICIWFELTHEQLKKYKSILSWNYIVSNHKIKWNTAIIDEFKDDIFQSNDSFAEFNCNDALPWSIDFIQRYEDLWDWNLLAQNPCVMGNLEIRNHFYNRLYPFIEEYGESCLDSSKSFGERYCDILDSDSESFKKHKELQFQHSSEILKAKTIDWRLLSLNTLLPWSEELIEKYIDSWHWSELSTNESVPWDLKLIKTFEHKIDWTKDITDNNGVTRLNGTSISNNMSIEWDSILLSTFSTKLNNWDISISDRAKWNIDLLIQFTDFWEYGTLSLNKIVWSKVFHQFETEEYLMPLLDFVLEKHSKD